MRKSWAVLATVLVCGGAWAAPVGPGGRIYLSRTYTNQTVDCVTQLIRIDVDTNWDLVNDYGSIASVVNQYSLKVSATGAYNQHIVVTSPEVLHPRAHEDGSATGGDGSVFLAGYYDNSVHTRWYKIMPDGAVSILHPGTGVEPANNDPNGYEVPRTGGTVLSSAGYGGGYVVDRKGDFSAGHPESVVWWTGQRDGGMWADVNGNDAFGDAGDVFRYTGYTYQGLGGMDSEVAGPPSHYNGTDNAVYGQGSGYELRYKTYDAAADIWTAYAVFYQYMTPSGTYNPYGKNFLFRSNGIAASDIDGDGNTDVFAYSSEPTNGSQGVRTGNAIFRLADLDDTGKVEVRSDGIFTDLLQVVYDDDSLPGSENNLVGRADLELIRDPATGTWTLLMLMRDAGKLIALELADNGCFAGGADAYKEIATGLTAANMTLYGVEFDADPSAGDVIPEPGTLLLVGSGIVGALGWMRRRRMR